jgi:hypothetical protein
VAPTELYAHAVNPQLYPPCPITEDNQPKTQGNDWQPEPTAAKRGGVQLRDGPWSGWEDMQPHARAEGCRAATIV